MKKLIIIGAGPLGIEVLETINLINLLSGKQVYDCIGFLDDNREKWNTSILERAVLGPIIDANNYNDAVFVFAVGSPNNYFDREGYLEKAGVDKSRMETIIHPTAVISNLAVIENGCVIMPYTVIGPYAHLGCNVIVSPHVIINHGVNIGDFTIIAGQVSVAGDVSVGRSCYLGMGSQIKGGLTLADYCCVGMGSNVLGDVAERTIVAGNPSIFLKELKTL
ncbi:acetyltransferase [Brevibacillus centrosporus]|uniref:Sugar O-acyltransferase, sialic acid O-acetyltransferase NeuD family n=1 Tax=Brevibacillus centrosporus TaxID=54910 RepID=A0A1I4CEV2_9BACL|nr:acetyltransferase [Brevibacillus centrosporus]SFK79738.1 sugar O-acyltransferase, sialic acid O-acetyltransferase NeuD family [Brevibacillus centrosporus]